MNGRRYLVAGVSPNRVRVQFTYETEVLLNEIDYVKPMYKDTIHKVVGKIKR